MSPSIHRVSMVMLAFNQERTVRSAVASCLAQQCEPIEIVLSDDFSTDATFAILQELAAAYRGPHRVWARRNSANVGIGEHYNQLLAVSGGELLITAAGDDISLPDRAQRLIDAWDATGGRADLIASHVVDLTDDDKLHDVMRVDDLAEWKSVELWAAQRPYIIGAGHAFTRRMMQRFGPLAAGVFYEDQIMVFRAIASGGALTVDAPLVHYRRGGTSRKPVFESTEHMRWWTARQLGRELAEIRQLAHDGRIAGCEQLVRDHVGFALRKADYLDRLNNARTNAERWAAYKEATSLAGGWRFRKMLHAAYPHTSLAIRRCLAAFRAWRHRRRGPSSNPL